MRRPKVFLSYAREDVERIRQLKQFLSGKGIECWLDVDEILPGEKWRVAIDQGLAHSDFIIVCLSYQSVQKRGFVQKEMRLALEAVDEMLDNDIFLIPVRLDDCEIPTKFQEYQYIDLFVEGGAEKLVEALHVGMKRRIAGQRKSEIQTPLRLGESENVEKLEDDTLDLSDLGGASLIDFLGRTKKSKKSKK